MKSLLLIASLFAMVVAPTVGLASLGSAQLLKDGRLKIQFSVESQQSKGSYRIRQMLLQEGFQNDNGMVSTEEALAPLELYNYLYKDGRYVFTLFLPVTDIGFVSFGANGFVSFQGEAAKKLFEVVKNHAPQTPLTNLEQYKWQDHAYCDKNFDSPPNYRCFFYK